MSLGRKATIHIMQGPVDYVEDRETLKASNLRSNIAKLVFKSIVSGHVWIISGRLKVEGKKNWC